MRRYIRLILLLPIVVVLCTQSSCKKYLDVKRRQNLAIPSSLKDLQYIIDNQSGNLRSPKLLEFLADNHYLTSATWNSAGLNYRLTYVWDKNEPLPTDNWADPYFAIYNANFVLDYLPLIEVSGAEVNDFNNIKGTALFYRAFMFHQLAQLYCKPYSISAATDPGIVVRLTAAVEAPSVRSNVQETYDQIISDLNAAAELLPETSLFSTRPTKRAAYGMLARVYLSMRDYENAELHANNALTINNTLLNYNSLSSFSFPGFGSNPEIIFLSGTFYYLLEPVYNKIDTTLYRSYDTNDLRRKLFFGETGRDHHWVGSYFPDNVRQSIFDGIATDEIYLIRAECRARSGNKDNAMSDLNALLRNRWKNGTFSDLTANNSVDALNLILVERRKELLFRGLRWSDIRRLNLDGANISLTRVVNNTTYILPPNDFRSVLLIPIQEISQSGISQNFR